jgi:exosortase C (VPDSG-CTERM-specific)
VVLLVLFAKPLYELAWFAARSSLYSHILLIPVVSGYLVWQRRNQKPRIDTDGHGGGPEGAQDPKAEGRNPKEIRNPKSEIRNKFEETESFKTELTAKNTARQSRNRGGARTFLSAASNDNSRAIKTFTATDTEGIAADRNVRAPAQETSAQPASNFDYCSAESTKESAGRTACVATRVSKSADEGAPRSTLYALRTCGGVLVALGAVVLAGYWLARGAGWKPGRADYLAAMTFSFLSFLAGTSCFLLERETMRRVAFPLAFLVFMVPFPGPVLDWIEKFLEHRSADAAYLLLAGTGMPVLREGTLLHLPGFAMNVAPECSGIHSTLVLFITSVLAAHVLLRSGWAKALLVLLVVPLAVVRNGLRIFTLGELCVNVDVRWIDSEFHHRGGPIWFVLSLIPFFLMLYFLRACETRKTPESHAKVAKVAKE